MITGNFPCYALKTTIDYAHTLSCSELGVIRLDEENILSLGSTYNLQTLYLIIWYDERFFGKSCSFVSVTIIKSEVEKE